MAGKMTENNSEQFSLRWNNFHSNLSTGFHAFLQGEDLVDVTLATGGQFVQAHKLVLSVCSPYLKNLFKMNPCKHPIVILKDVGHKELLHILEFMYRGEVNVRQDDLTEFLKTAEMLQVKGLTGDETPANTCASQVSGKQTHLSPVSVKNEDTSARPAKRARTSCSLPPQSAPISPPPPPIQPASPAISVASSLTNDSQRDLDFIDLAKTKEEPVEYDSDIEKGDEHSSIVHNRGESFSTDMHKSEEVTSFIPNFHKNEDSFMHLLGSGDNSQHQDSSLGPSGMFGNLPPLSGSMAHDSGGSSQDGGQGSALSPSWCPFCHKQFVNRYNMLIHVKNMHGDDRGPFQCSQCNKIVKNKNSLRVHTYIYHKKNKPSAPLGS